MLKIAKFGGSSLANAQQFGTSCAPTRAAA